MIFYFIRVTSFLTIIRMAPSLRFMALLSGPLIHRQDILLPLFHLKMVSLPGNGKYLQMALPAWILLLIQAMHMQGRWVLHKGRMVLYISVILTKEKYGALCIKAIKQNSVQRSWQQWKKERQQVLI